MIHVIATIHLKPGVRDAYLAVLRANVPTVLAEDGCLGYAPTEDAPSGLPPQGGVRPDVVTIVEGWTSLDALRAHLATPHMQAYRVQAKDLVESVHLQVLQPV